MISPMQRKPHLVKTRVEALGYGNVIVLIASRA
jgi:hypothetical protein